MHEKFHVGAIKSTWKNYLVDEIFNELLRISWARQNLLGSFSLLALAPWRRCWLHQICGHFDVEEFPCCKAFTFY